MRILIFHGYLLSGTGSNIYTVNVARELVSLGHEVHLFCQDRHAEEVDFVSEIGDITGGGIELRKIRERHAEGSCTVYRPEIGAILPVYVADTYEGFEAKTFDELSERELEQYLAVNIKSVATVVEKIDPDIALANHLVMGPVILARALAGLTSYAVKVHGSALEYTVAPNPRFLPLAREGLDGARAILVGSSHVGDRLIEVMGDRSLSRRVCKGPPGVDTQTFRLHDESQSRRTFEELMESMSINGIDPKTDRLVIFVGKLIVSKGVELLLAAWPYVSERHKNAKLLIVGFGRYRETLEQMLKAQLGGDREVLNQIALRGRELEGGEPDRLEYLTGFLENLQGEEERNYFDLASDIEEGNVRFLGEMDHLQLAALLPVCEVMTVPSTFPEAFGMVAAEAAACGVWPIVANHSGLAEVSSSLASAVPKARSDLLSFDLRGSAVTNLASRICEWMDLPGDDRKHLSAAVSAEAKSLWSWEGVARNVVDAARGKLTDDNSGL